MDQRLFGKEWKVLIGFNFDIQTNVSNFHCNHLFQFSIHYFMFNPFELIYFQLISNESWLQPASSHQNILSHHSFFKTAGGEKKTKHLCIHLPVYLELHSNPVVSRGPVLHACLCSCSHCFIYVRIWLARSSMRNKSYHVPQVSYYRSAERWMFAMPASNEKRCCDLLKSRGAPAQSDGSFEELEEVTKGRFCIRLIKVTWIIRQHWLAGS